MILNENQIAELKTAAAPLVKWLNENANPHCKVIVETDGAEFTEGSAAVKITDYIESKTQ